MGLRDRIKRRLTRGKSPEQLRREAVERRASAESLPSAPSRDGYRAVCSAERLPEGGAAMVDVEGRTVAVFRSAGHLYAVDNDCRHEDGPLGEGVVTDLVVTCPYHDWRYDLRTGDCLTDPNRPLSCYAVRETGGFVWVGPKTRQGVDDRGGEHDDGLTMSDEPLPS